VWGWQENFFCDFGPTSAVLDHCQKYPIGIVFLFLRATSTQVSTGAEGGTGGEDDTSTVIDGIEFVDVDGRLYRVTGMDDATHVLSTCFYPRRNNALLGCEKSFNMPLAKELIQRRLNG
jgi:hypothetical protein